MKNGTLVIIVTYNGMKWIDRCVSSVLASSVPADIFIVDNGSSDGTREHIAATWKDIRLVESGSNLGFGKANNIGLQYAVDNGYGFIYLLNQDAWVEKDTFAILQDLHGKHPEYGILSPMQIQGNGMHLDANFLERMAMRTIGDSLTDDLYFGCTKDIYDVEDVMAAHWSITRECLLAVGGFSPTFRHYGEDNNFIDRAFHHGFKVGIVPGTRGVHDREFRKDTPKSLAHRCYTLSLIWLSDINCRPKFLKSFLKYFQYTGKYGIFRQYRQMFVCIFSLPSIMRNRRLSRRKGAFLNIG